MADDKTPDEGKCVACDVVFYLLCGLGALAIGVIAYDAMSGGQATEWLDRTFRKAGPMLASVTTLRGDSDDAASS